MPKVTTNANAVFNEIIAKHKLKNDTALCGKLDVAPSAVSAMRAQRIPLGKAMMARIINNKLMSARRLKELVESI